MSSPYSLALLFNEDVTPSPVALHQQATLAQAVRCLAEELLPDWKIYTDDVLSPEISKNLTMAIADAYHGPASSKTVAHRRACDWLAQRKVDNPTCRTLLTATLPEASNLLTDSGLDASTATRVVDHYFPLATTNVNAWDELYNTIKLEESQIVFKTRTLASDELLLAFKEWLESSQGREAFDRPDEDLFFDGDVKSGSENGDSREQLYDEIGKLILEKGIEGTIRCRKFVLKNFRGLVHLRLAHCEFNGPVLLFNNTVKDNSYISRCKFHQHINVAFCTFEDSFLMEANHFVCHTVADTAIEPHVEPANPIEPQHDLTTKDMPLVPARKRAFLPWFSHVKTQGEFAFRLNKCVTADAKQELDTFQQAVMFHQCVFSDRVDYLASDSPAKLSFYNCQFLSGCVADISYTFEWPIDRAPSREADGGMESGDNSESENPGKPLYAFADDRFWQRGIDRLEVRLCYCHIGAPITIRESPSPSSQVEIPFVSEGGLPPVYNPEKGIGVNLTGATLAGCLDLSGIRVAWINAERVNVTGGSLLTHRDALTSHHLPNLEVKKIFREWRPKHLLPNLWASAKLFASRVFLVSAQRVNFVFAEKTVLDREPERFSRFFRQSCRLAELKDDLLRHRDRAHRIAAQYEALRLAYANGNNTYSEEDFCQFKRLYWLSRAERLVRHWTDWAFTGLASISALLMAALVTIGISWLNDSDSLWDTFVNWYGFIAIGALLLMTLGLRSAKRVARGVLSWLYRNVLGYLVYPARVVVSTLTVVIGFAALYAITVAIHDTYDLGAVVISSDGAKSVMSHPVSVVVKSGKLGEISVSGAQVEERPEGVLLVLKKTTPATQPSASLEGALGHLWQLVRSSIAHFPRMVYFSGVTFTTLGYGDERPAGILRPIANVEALLGAVWLSFTTVALLRHVSRK